MKNKVFLEYIWLDGSNPQRLRSKTKIIENKTSGDHLHIYYTECKADPTKLPTWNFDGSSTGQAETKNSELLLKPVNIFKDPFRQSGFVVVCEVYNTDGTPHESNVRWKIRNELRNTICKNSTCGEFDPSIETDTQWGWEQEYFIFDNTTGLPLMWKELQEKDSPYPRPQGEYYCGIGTRNVSGRLFTEEHANMCIVAEIGITGINAEVALGQYEYQVSSKGALESTDQLWVSRYILDRLSEKYQYHIEYHPKPFVGNEWNGSGMHVNFSNSTLRNVSNKKQEVINACEKMGKAHPDQNNYYGTDNDKRLTGHNETSSINEFKYGIGDRTASIRIPSSIDDQQTPGYFEDRRPSSNANPYDVAYFLIKTIYN